MNHERIPTTVTQQHGSSNREFGLVFSVLFMIMSAFDYYSKLPFSLDESYLKYFVFLQNTEFAAHPLTLIFSVLSLVFLLLALLLPKSLSPLNWLWTKFGIVLHKLVSPIVLGLLFYIIFTPFGVMMRLFGKDSLRLHFDKGAASYWIERTPAGPEPKSLEDQY